MITKQFQKTILDYYHNHGRDLLWRRTDDPYKIFVSEIMLQQTQVARVLTKYPQFIKQFPSFHALAKAPLKSVLSAWQGMGYNRRALYLKRSAEIIVNKYSGRLPNDPHLLEQLPGIGKATAASIVAFAFNKPTVFIETNIRRAFIYHFFQNGRPTSILDTEILPLVKQTLDCKNPRQWYWALMDYGSMLAKTTTNPNRRSAHHTIQSKFEGSARQLRGQIIKLLLERPQTLSEIQKQNTGISKDRIRASLQTLERDLLVHKNRNKYTIKVRTKI